MASLSLIYPAYQVPKSITPQLEDKGVVKRTGEAGMLNGEQVTGNGAQEFRNKATTLALSESPSAPESLELDTLAIEINQRSKFYRRKQITYKLKQIIPLLNRLKTEINTTKSVISIVKIRNILDSTWENIESGDKDIALTISALQKLLSGDFWKNFTVKTTEQIKKILLQYIESYENFSYDKISKLMIEENFDILPKLRNGENENENGQE